MFKTREPDTPENKTGPLVSIIVSTYNGSRNLDQALGSFLRNRYPNYEVVMADDGSDNSETSEIIRKHQAVAGPKLVHAKQEKKGFRLARSRNNAVKRSKGEILIFLDHDIVVPDNFVGDVVKCFRKGWFLGGRRVKLDEDITNQIYGGKVSSSNLFGPKFKIHALCKKLTGARYLFPLRNRGPETKPQDWRGMSGFCIVVDKKSFEQVDGFDGIYNSYGVEDWDLFARLENSGLKAAYLPGSCTVMHLWHNENPVDLNTENYGILEQVVHQKRILAVEGYSKTDNT